jgi:aldose 1-epimerase
VARAASLMLRSGEQLEIASGAQRAIFAGVGATLRRYAVGDWQVIDGFDADEPSPGGRGQVLMPWPNRVAGGRYAFGGKIFQLPIDEPELGHAIHGLARWVEWSVDERAADRVRLRHRLCARPGYPFPLELSVEAALSGAGLTLTFGAVNLGREPCPFGAGAHPYFAFPGARADAVELGVPAAEFLDVDARSIPRARRPVEGSALDFRRPRAIGAAHLDCAFTGLRRDERGRAWVSLRHGAERLRVWLDGAFGFVQVYTGDTLPDRARRRLGVAVEPMSCAPDAFNSGDGLRLLQPGESFRASFGLLALPP